MAEPKEHSLTDMVSMMKDTNIKDDVHSILGAHGQGLQTWGDVNAFMMLNAKSLGPGIVDGVKEKLRSEVKDKKKVQELMRALKYDLFLTSNERTADESRAERLKSIPFPSLSTRVRNISSACRFLTLTPRRESHWL